MSMTSVGIMGTKWFQRGKDLRQCKTVEAAIQTADLAWGVEKRPIFRQFTINGVPSFVEIPSHCCIVKDDTDEVLGVPTKSYEPVQNIRAFQFLDELVGIERLEYTTAGLFEKGKRVFMLLRKS